MAHIDIDKYLKLKILEELASKNNQFKDRYVMWYVSKTSYKIS